jgi:hypothetical protein
MLPNPASRKAVRQANNGNPAGQPGARDKTRLTAKVLLDGEAETPSLSFESSTRARCGVSHGFGERTGEIMRLNW